MIQSYALFRRISHPSKTMPPFLSHQSWSPIYTILVLYMLNLVIASSSSNSGVKLASKSLEPLPLFGLKPDKFVASAPLIVAAVCKDGVAIVATHTSPLIEPLLMEETNDNYDDTEDDGEEQEDTKMKLPLDIPLSFRGPFRIHSIDNFGTTLTCAGWRTDGEQLAQALRSLARSEADRFGVPTSALEYGRFLSQKASSWMATCAVSSSQRALSTVGLLASGGKTKGDECGLWLVDTTGAYRVCAHAVGLGAKAVNERLGKIDFLTMTSKECALRLLETIMEEPPLEGTNKSSKDEEAKQWKLPENARVEVALVEPGKRKNKRIRVDELLLDQDWEKV